MAKNEKRVQVTLPKSAQAVAEVRRIPITAK